MSAAGLAIAPAMTKPTAQRKSDRPLLAMADLSGGFSGAIVSLAFALSLGVLSFAPLGTHATTVGVAAGCTAVLWGQLAAWLAGGTLPHGSVPRVSTSLLLASFVAVLAHDPAFELTAAGGPGRLLAMTSLCVALSGLLQVAIGALRLCQVARYIPYPLVAGFMCGIAVLVLISQIGPLTGIDVHGNGGLNTLEDGTLIAALATTGAFFAAHGRVKRAPALLFGLVAGCVTYYAVRTIMPEVRLGPLIGPVSLGIPLPFALAPLLDVAGADAARVLPSLAATAALIAVFGTLDTLFAAVVVDQATNGRHNPHREVIAHGLANVASGMCGGLPVVYSAACALMTREAGGGGGRSLTVTLAIVAVTLIVGTPTIAHVPVVVLAGVLLVSAVGLVDRWVRSLIARLPSDAGSRDPARLLSLATVLVVAVATVALGLPTALLIGLVLCIVLLMVGMNKALVRSVVSARDRPSRRQWATAERALLEDARKRIKIVELEGPLYFGNAERLAVEVERAVGSADIVVLDFRYVTTIDATAALLAERLERRLSTSGIELLFAGVTPQGRHGRAIQACSAFVDPAQRRWFRDADRAVEWAEGRAVHRADCSPEVELPVEALPLVKSIEKNQQQFVARLLCRQELGRGHVVIHENDSADSVYLLARGAVEISMMGGDSVGTRITTIEAGSMFGEMAFVDGRVCSATAVVVEPAVIYMLSRRSLLEELFVTHPNLVSAVLIQLVNHEQQSLQRTTKLVREMDSARG